MPLNIFYPHQTILSASVNNNFSVVMNQDVPEEDISSQANGSNLIFTVAHPYVAGSIKIFVDGLRQRKGASYNFVESGTNTITFHASEAPEGTQDVIADYRRSDL